MNKVQKTWTQEEKDTLVDLYDAGYTYDSIAEAMHRSKNSVMNQVQRYIIGSKDGSSNSLNRGVARNPNISLSKRKKDFEGLSESTKERYTWTPDPSRYHIIDGQKLYMELVTKGYTMAKAERELGLNDGNLSHWKSKNYLPKYAAVLLERILDIKLEDILPEPEPVIDETPTEITVEIPTAEPKKDSVLTEEDHKQLYKTVYTAVYEAVKKAWAE